MAIKYKGLGHIALRSRKENVEEFTKFFTDMFEFEHAFDLRDEQGEVYMSYYKVSDGQFIKIIPETDSNPMEYYDGTKKQSDKSQYHVCIQVSDRKVTVADLEGKKGIPVRRREDDGVGLCKSHCMFANDPDGGEWELMQFTPESLQVVCDKELN